MKRTYPGILVASLLLPFLFCSLQPSERPMSDSDLTEFRVKDQNDNPTLQELLDSYWLLTKRIDSLKNEKEDLAARSENYTRHLSQFFSQYDELSRKLDSLADMPDSIAGFNRERLLKEDSVCMRKIDFVKRQIQENLDRECSADKTLAIRMVEFNFLLSEIRNSFRKVQGSLKVSFMGVQYLIFVAHTDSCEIRLHLKNTDGRPLYTLDNVIKKLTAEKSAPVMVTNAGMFTDGNNPEGLYIEGHEGIQFPLDTQTNKRNLNFYLQPNGVFCIDTNNYPYVLTTADYIEKIEDRKISLKLATQSGPMLVIKRSIHPAFVKGSSNLNIRSGVGITEKKTVIFACTIDRSNFYDFALFFRDVFNCADALFLDGAISLMYLKDINPQTRGGHFGPMISVSKK